LKIPKKTQADDKDLYTPHIAKGRESTLTHPKLYQTRNTQKKKQKKARNAGNFTIQQAPKKTAPRVARKDAIQRDDAEGKGRKEEGNFSVVIGSPISKIGP